MAKTGGQVMEQSGLAYRVSELQDSDGNAVLTLGGTSTGTTIAATATEKVGFFGATPVAQQDTTGTTTGFTAGAGTAVLDDSTFTGNSGSTAYTIGDVVLALKNLGLLDA